MQFHVSVGPGAGAGSCALIGNSGALIVVLRSDSQPECQCPEHMTAVGAATCCPAVGPCVRRINEEAHPVQYCNDGMSTTSWQSPSGTAAVNVTLDLLFTHVRRSRPRATNLNACIARIIGHNFLENLHSSGNILHLHHICDAPAQRGGAAAITRRHCVDAVPGMAVSATRLRRSFR